MLAELKSVEKTYREQGRKVEALVDVNLTLESGEFVAIEGKSGCGKSTLLLTLGGLLRPDRGAAVVGQQELYSLSAEERAALRARQIGFVFQQFHLVPYLSVRDNVIAASLGLDDGPAGCDARADELLAQFGLIDRQEHLPGKLSTGERQRTALARALLNGPRLILADEPTGNLDAQNARIVLEHLAEFAASGGAVLLVTHDPRAAEYSQRRMKMTAGRLGAA
jgi:ABC-type lipoprotein export system ATPase subunit